MPANAWFWIGVVAGVCGTYAVSIGFALLLGRVARVADRALEDSLLEEEHRQLLEQETQQ